MASTCGAVAPRQRSVAMLSRFSRHVGAHGARHPDAAQQQREGADQPQVAAQPPQRVAEPPLLPLRGADRHPLRAQPPPVSLVDRRRRGGIGEAQVGLVLHPAPRPQQPRGLQGGGGDVDARRERGGDPRLARHLAQRPGHPERRLADAHRVAHARAQRHQQRRVRQHDAAAPQLRPAPGGLRLDGAVERPAALHGPHLRQPGRPGARQRRHGGERRRPRDRVPGALQRVQQRPGALAEGAGAGERQVGAHEDAGLVAHPRRHARREALRRHQRGHAQRDG